MDIRMEGMDGLTASKEIITGHPDAKILLLTTFADDDYIIKAIRTGAKGYISRQLHLRSLLYTTDKPSLEMRS